MAVQPYIKMTTTPFTQYTLPHPAAKDGYSVELEYRGGLRKMANGTVAVDLVNSSAKRRVSLTWNTLSATEKATLISAFDLLKSSICEFRDPEGNVFNVTRDADNATLKFQPLLAAGGALRFRVTLYLVES